jgi:hypothetical protein
MRGGAGDTAGRLKAFELWMLRKLESCVVVFEQELMSLIKSVLIDWSKVEIVHRCVVYAVVCIVG